MPSADPPSSHRPHPQVTVSALAPTPHRTLALYGAPLVGVYFAMVLFVAYISKYATDVLLMAPAVVGLVFGIGRIWDAFTDPVAGYLSDRTRLRLGRRRPWLLASALPIALFFLMLWNPPRALDGGRLVVWMIVAIFGFNAASTVFLVPHMALGAEIAEGHHTRTRVFAVRQFLATIGTTLALVLGMSLLANAENPRDTAFWLALGIGGLCIATIVPTALLLRERSEYRERGERLTLASTRDTWRNPHARVLYVMIFVEHMGSGASMVLAPYVLHYVIGMPGMIGFIFAFYTGASFLSIPFWSWLAGRIGKKRTWLIGMATGALGYLLLFFVGEGDLAWMCMVVCLTGPSSACGTVLGASILADVVDYDELHTGQRKEGVYYSFYSVLFKTSSGVMAGLTGASLQWVGFVPNVEQTEEVRLMMRSLNGLVPLACIIVGAAIFSRFRLTEREHARIRAALDA